MKVVYNNPILELTTEEENILTRASEILESICDNTDDYDNCKHKCPIYKYCPYHHIIENTYDRQLHNLLDSIVHEAEREKE